jgi:hypothetical protein
MNSREIWQTLADWSLRGAADDHDAKLAVFEALAECALKLRLPREADGAHRITLTLRRLDAQQMEFADLLKPEGAPRV